VSVKVFIWRRLLGDLDQDVLVLEGVAEVVNMPVGKAVRCERIGLAESSIL